MGIQEKAKEILASLPPGVNLVAAAKGRSAEEVSQAVDAGIKIVGENYVQEAEKKIAVIGCRVKWHCIGHLQTNKAKKALELFDMIETLDSLALAGELNKYAVKEGRVLPVLIEVNSGREPQKSGILPEEVEGFLEQLAGLANLKIEGLMTMGPLVSNPEEARPFFRETRLIFEKLKGPPRANCEMKYLSMGMSDTWKTAIEEGANLIRIGTAIFGPRT